MDWLHLPPMNALRAFSAVAEAGSYTVAAERLNVTQAAVSQQVKSLERHLGVALVTRRGRGIELTEPGIILARELGIGFEIIGRGVERLAEHTAQRPVQVTMSPAFAVEWLLPRMAEFQREHPEITLMLKPTSELVQIRPGGIDVAIRYHDRRMPRKEEDSLHYPQAGQTVPLAFPQLCRLPRKAECVHPGAQSGDTSRQCQQSLYPDEFCLAYPARQWRPRADPVQPELQPR